MIAVLFPFESTVAMILSVEPPVSLNFRVVVPPPEDFPASAANFTRIALRKVKVPSTTYENIAVTIAVIAVALGALIKSICDPTAAGEVGIVSVFALIASISRSSRPPFTRSVCSSPVSARIAAISVSR